MATRTRTVEIPTESGGDARIEDHLRKRGVNWKWLPKVEAADFDIERSMANNARHIALDKTRVEAYAEDMKRGDVFPPIVAYRESKNGSLIVVDGNHRINGAALAKKPVAVYDITGTATDVVVMLSFEANAHHGLPTSEQERISQALWLINQGVTIPDAAAMVSLPVRIVTKASKDASTDQRFIDNNIAPVVTERLGKPVRWRLSHISTDAGFRAAVDLCDRAKLSADEVFKVVTEINTFRDSDRQVAFVQNDLEERYMSRVSETAGGVFKRGAMTPKSRIGMSLTNIVSLPDNLASVAELYVGPERAEVANKMRAAAKRLNELARTLSA